MPSISFILFLTLRWEMWGRQMASGTANSLHCPLVVNPAGKKLALTAGTLWGICCTSHLWSLTLDIPVFSQNFHSSCSFCKFWDYSQLFGTLQDCWKIKLGCKRIWEIKKSPIPHPVTLAQNHGPKIQGKTFQLGRLCSFHSQLSGDCAHRGRHRGTSEMSYLSKPLFRKWIWTYSWSHLLTQSLPSSLPFNVYSVGEWWQWGLGRQIQIGGCSLGFNSIFEGNWAPHKGSHQPNNCPLPAWIFCSLPSIVLLHLL